MILFLVGFVALMAQVILLRELQVTFFGVELAYLVALAAWLAATACGAFFAPRRTAASSRLAEWLVAAAALSLPFDVAFVRASRTVFDATPGAYLPIDVQMLVLLAAVVPQAWMTGLAFRAAASRHAASGGRVSGAYAIESGGAAVGGVVATGAFWAGGQTFALALATPVVAASLFASTAQGRRRRLASTALVVLLALVAWTNAGWIDTWLTRLTHPRLVGTMDTPYARVSITQNGSQVSVFENDVLAYESETAHNEQLPHLAALQHPSPRRVLLLGGIVERVEQELRRHRPAVVAHVEIDGRLARAISDAEPIVADPRRYLERGDDGAYDLIVVALSEPVSGLTNRFYTREFFARCAERLARGGVLALRLSIPGNYTSSSSLLRAASVDRALRASFPFVEWLPAVGTTVVVASGTPLPRLEEVVERLETREVGTRLVTRPYLEYVYTNDRRESLRQAIAGTDAPVNRDARPVTYLYAAVGWLSRFVPALVNANLRSITQPRAWSPWWHVGPLVVVIALFLAGRRVEGARGAVLAGAAGLSGMVLETVLVLDYQAKSGALFEDLGLLVTAFMAGSALGAWHVSARSSVGVRRLLLALSATALLCAWLVTARVPLSLAFAVILLALVGGCVAAIFAATTERLPKGEEAGIGRLYAADVFGGCIGSLLGSLVLVPLLGLDVTALAVAGFALLAVVAVPAR